MIMRFRSLDGQWTIDVIRLTLTGSNRDGECFRVCQYGFFVAEARTIDELREHVDLEEVLAITRLGQMPCPVPATRTASLPPR